MQLRGSESSAFEEFTLIETSSSPDRETMARYLRFEML
jgi:hypothetical protein